MIMTKFKRVRATETYEQVNSELFAAMYHFFFFFFGFVLFCFEVLRPSQPNGVMSSAVSLPNHTFTGQAWFSKRLTSIVHILSTETDNCLLEGRE